MFEQVVLIQTAGRLCINKVQWKPSAISGSQLGDNGLGILLSRRLSTKVASDVLALGNCLQNVASEKAPALITT